MNRADAAMATPVFAPRSDAPVHQATTPRTPPAEDRYLVPALQRGLQLLAQFSRNERALTGAELSRRLGLPRASVFRILQTLEQMGFVERVGESAHYKLGMAVLRLGFEFLASMELTELGRPVIDDLSDATGLSAHLVVRDGREVVFVAKSTGRSFIFNSIQVGARLPAHATVLGRVLLGGLSADELASLYRGIELSAFTEQTPTTLAALKAQIDDDARRGYGVSQGGFESAISTIAAPVLDSHHRVSAAVSVTVPAQQVESQQLDGLVAQVRQAALRLSQHISHLPSTSSTIP
ncbi:MAG: IclR family transcriptional regulator [Burkholderiaceae bacterium]